MNRGQRSVLIGFWLCLLMLLLPGVLLADTYQQKCALCHGAEGVSKMPGIPALSKTQLSADEIIKVIDNGRGNMPKISLTNDQKREVAAFILNTLKK